MKDDARATCSASHLDAEDRPSEQAMIKWYVPFTHGRAECSVCGFLGDHLRYEDVLNHAAAHPELLQALQPMVEVEGGR